MKWLFSSVFFRRNILLEQVPVGTMPIQEKSINSIRIKVTEKCPWQCNFCHDEGGRCVSDIRWTPKLQEALASIRQALPNINTIHETGGEPSKHPRLEEVNERLVENGFAVKITTNGQLDAERLRSLIDSGTQSFNFSVLSLDAERFLTYQKGRGISWKKRNSVSGNRLPEANHRLVAHKSKRWARKQIDRQIARILQAKSLGVGVKVNTVISTVGDIQNAWEIYTWTKQNGIDLRIMIDLSSSKESARTIKSFMKKADASIVSRHAERGSSTCKTVYRDKSGYEFAFKQIRAQKLNAMCTGCPRIANNTCEEHFYGIRLQQNPDGIIYIILCIQESSCSTQMTVADFLSSDHLKELQNHCD